MQMASRMHEELAFLSVESSPSSSDSPGASGSPPKKASCRVCGGVLDGALYGVDSCRACSEFFRRCVLLDKEFSCRDGTDACDVSKSTKRTCRSCRYNKCLEVGMLREYVNPRTTRGRQLKKRDSKEIDEDQEPSTSEGAEASLKPPSPQAMTYPLLCKIYDFYTRLTSSRLSSELSLYPLDQSQLLYANPNRAVLRQLGYETYKSIHQAAIPLIAHFCDSSFIEFKALTAEEKWSLFKDFIPLFQQFETIYRTVRNFGEDHSKRQITVTGCFDTNVSMYEFSDDAEGRALLGAFELIKKRAQDPHLIRVRECFMRMALDDVEVAAVVAILLWSPRMDSVSDDVYELCAKMKDAIFRDLHAYYRYGLKIIEYASRLGELMTLLVNIQEEMKKKYEEVALFLMFNVFEEDSYMSQIFRR